MTPAERDGLIRALQGDIADWTGLPTGVKDDDLALIGGTGSPPRTGRLSGQAVTWREYPKRVRAYFSDEGTVFLIWVDDPFEGAPHQLPAGLDAPEAELVGVGDRLSGTMQLVWATRGLTAYVTLGGRSLVGVALYQPTTAEYYRSSLGASEATPYRPPTR